LRILKMLLIGIFFLLVTFSLEAVDKTHPSKIEKTGLVKDITRFESLLVCEKGPECLNPWRVTFRIEWKDSTGEVIFVEEVEVVMPIEMVEVFAQRGLDGDDKSPGINEQRGHP